MKGQARWSKVASRDLAALKGPSWERSHGLLTPRLPGALGRARDWLHAARCSWVGRWMGSGAQEAQPAGSVRPSAQDGGRPVHAPPPGKPQALRPCCPPRKNTGEQPQGGGAMGSPPPHRSANSYPPQLLHKSMTYLQPAPDGPAPCQPAARRRAKRRRGRCQTGAGAEGPVRTGRGPGAASRRQAGRAPPPAAAAPSARHPRAEPRLRWAWGSPPQLLGTPALSGPCTRMRTPHTCAIPLMHTQHTHTHAHAYT